MNLFFRLLYLLVAARRRPKLGLLETGRVDMRVWPGDLDVLWHMNNGRYLTIRIWDVWISSFALAAGQAQRA